MEKEKKCDIYYFIKYILKLFQFYLVLQGRRFNGLNFEKNHKQIIQLVKKHRKQ